MKKNILVVDDSALMRMVMCDIIKTDERFNLAGKAQNGKEALDLLMKNKYDAVVLDVNMPVMGGLELLRELQTKKIPVRVMMASTDTRDGAKVTMDALELGAIDFVHKSGNIKNNRTEEFQKNFLETLYAVSTSREPTFGRSFNLESIKASKKFVSMVRKHNIIGNKIVAIASSTGGPKALQAVIPKLPKDLNVLHTSQIGRVFTLIVRGSPAEIKTRMAGFAPILMEALPLTLEEIFIYELGGEDYAVRDIVF